MIQSLIFGFGHKAKHGKDTVAKFIQEARGKEYDIRVYSFAKELKDEVNTNALQARGMKNLFATKNGGNIDVLEYMQTNGNFVELPEWVQYEENPDMSDPLCPLGKQRTLLQWWGTEFRRSIEPDYWVMKLSERLEKDKPEIAFITDVRFPNEVKFVREYGDVIKVVRQGIPSVNTHASELALDYMSDADWNAVIYNDGTLDELRQQSVFVFDELMDEVHKPSRGTEDFA